MFYVEFCKTDSQKRVFDAILMLSKNSNFIAVQELYFLGIPPLELAGILTHFDKNNLFTSAQYLSESHPVIFSIK